MRILKYPLPDTVKQLKKRKLGGICVDTMDWELNILRFVWQNCFIDSFDSCGLCVKKDVN